MALWLRRGACRSSWLLGGRLRFRSACRLREEALAPPPPWCAGWERPGLAAGSPPGFGSRLARPGAGGGGRSGRAGPGRGGWTGERGPPRDRARGARRPRGAAAPGRGGNRAAQGFPALALGLGVHSLPASPAFARRGGCGAGPRHPPHVAVTSGHGAENVLRAEGGSAWTGRAERAAAALASAFRVSPRS